MFELSFRDERYLPFEGAGAISRWRIEMPKDCNAFDFDTISDVVLTLNYTSREGGDTLRQMARAKAVPPQGPQVRLFSVRHEFPSHWHGFMHSGAGLPNRLLIELKEDHFPLWFRGQQVRLDGVDLFVDLTPSSKYDDADPLRISGVSHGQPVVDRFVVGGSPIAHVPHARIENVAAAIPVAWSIRVEPSQ
jgi:hypothetical protein